MDRPRHSHSDRSGRSIVDWAEQACLAQTNMKSVHHDSNSRLNQDESQVRKACDKNHKRIELDSEQNRSHDWYSSDMSDSHSYRSRNRNNKNSDNGSVRFNQLDNRNQSGSDHCRSSVESLERLRKLSKSRHSTDNNRSKRQATIPLRHADPGEFSPASRVRHRSEERSFSPSQFKSVHSSRSPSRSRSFSRSRKNKKKKADKKKRKRSSSSSSCLSSSSSKDRSKYRHKGSHKKKKHRKSRSKKRDSHSKKRKRSTSPSSASSTSSSSSSPRRNTGNKRSRIQDFTQEIALI